MDPSLGCADPRSPQAIPSRRLHQRSLPRLPEAELCARECGRRASTALRGASSARAGGHAAIFEKGDSVAMESGVGVLGG